jgi:hypothetical protein
MLDFPVTPGAYQMTHAGWVDVFVTALSSSGDQIEFSTFLGGATSADWATALELTATGSIVVAGWTGSSDFPTTPGAFATNPSPLGDVFVSILDLTGSALLASTLAGGSSGDYLYGMTLAPDDEPVLAGSTNSLDFPTTPGAFDATRGGDQDGFVLRLNASLTNLVFSSYLGGSSIDLATGVDADPTGAATVCGMTISPDFPTTPGALDTVFNDGVQSGRDGFVIRFSPTGSVLHSTYLGGWHHDTPQAIAVDQFGHATLTGETLSTDFPISPGAFQPQCFWVFCIDAFVTRLDATGSTILFSSFLGGLNSENAYAIAVDGRGAAIVVGETDSNMASFPVTQGAYDTIGHPRDGFVSRVDRTGRTLEYSTFLGGSDTDMFGGYVALAVDSTGAVTVAGKTISFDFPVTAGAYDTVYALGKNFVTRLDALPTGVTKFGASTPGCSGPLAAGVSSQPYVNNSDFGLTCSDAPPNAIGLLGVAAAPLASPLIASGAAVWIDPAILFLLPVGSDEYGGARTSTPLAPGVVSAGMSAVVQFFWPDPCAAGGWAASNALQVVVQP